MSPESAAALRQLSLNARCQPRPHPKAIVSIALDHQVALLQCAHVLGVLRCLALVGGVYPLNSAQVNEEPLRRRCCCRWRADGRGGGRIPWNRVRWMQL